jgi:hypothetical protein
LPGYDGSRILLDGALTAGFDETTPVRVRVVESALGWVR